MINKFRKLKDLLNSFQQMQGDYTVMLVPHDGKGISRKDMDTAQIKKYATIAGGVALGTIGVIMLLSCMLIPAARKQGSWQSSAKPRLSRSRRFRSLPKALRPYKSSWLHWRRLKLMYASR